MNVSLVLLSTWFLRHKSPAANQTKGSRRMFYISVTQGWELRPPLPSLVQRFASFWGLGGWSKTGWRWGSGDGVSCQTRVVSWFPDLQFSQPSSIVRSPWAKEGQTNWLDDSPVEISVIVALRRVGASCEQSPRRTAEGVGWKLLQSEHSRRCSCLYYRLYNLPGRALWRWAGAQSAKWKGSSSLLSPAGGTKTEKIWRNK